MTIPLNVVSPPPKGNISIHCMLKRPAGLPCHFLPPSLPLFLPSYCREHWPRGLYNGERVRPLRAPRHMQPQSEASKQQLSPCEITQDRNEGLDLRLSDAGGQWTIFQILHLERIGKRFRQ